MAEGRDDYNDFMEKAQAKFKERNAILQNSTPNTKAKLMKSLEIDTVSTKQTESTKKTNIDIEKSSKVTIIPIKTIIETPDQHVKENINKFERLASSSKLEQKDEYKPVSVKDIKRRFENDSSAVFPDQGPKTKSPKVSLASPKRISTTHRRDLPVKSPKPIAPVIEDAPIEEDHLSESAVIEESPTKCVQESLTLASPVSLFDERLRKTMGPITPRRARLMDEINEDFQKHSNSLPRNKNLFVNFEDDNVDDDTPVVSLEQYRQDSLKRMTTSSDNTVEKLVYTSPAVDMPDNAQSSSKRNTDKIRQLDEFVNVCQTQLSQAKKALSLIINKPGRDEDEFIAANHILLNHRVVLEAAARMRDTLRFMEINDKRDICELPEMRASFAFHSIEFELNPIFVSDLLKEGSSCYFTVVIGHNETTRCSQHVSYRQNVKCRMLIDFYCAINNIEPGFKIYVQVYMLKIPKAPTEKRSNFVDTVGTLLRGEKHSNRNSDQRSAEPQFVNVGTAVISHDNMRMRNIEAEVSSVLAPRFDVKYDYHVSESTYKVEGYLRRYETVGGVGNWVMEYTRFNHWYLDSWLTQREKTEGKQAIRNVSLRRCTGIGEMSDSACYPHAFFIDYITEGNQKERLLFAARSEEEKEQWLKVLKGFVKGLKYWHH